MVTIETNDASVEWLTVVGHSLVVMFLLFCGLAFAYSYYDQINGMRMINHALDNHVKVIRLPELSNTQLVWKTSTNNASWNARFKLFYHIPKDVKVVFPDAPDYVSDK